MRKFAACLLGRSTPLLGGTRRFNAMPELFDLAVAVTDEASFLRFVAALRADREAAAVPSGANSRDWENDTIEDFLRAAQSWAEDSDFGRRVQLVDVSPWKRFAAFLYSGKIYE
jgi:hypothetical protein